MKKIVFGLMVSILLIGCKKNLSLEGTLKILMPEVSDDEIASIYDIVNEQNAIIEIKIFGGEIEKLDLNCGNYIIKIGSFKRGFQIKNDETTIIDFRDDILDDKK